MHKVVTINLNGRGYQVDDDAYEALRAYLDRADAMLQGNPDRQEILTDLEQAIADKGQRFLGPHKSIVNLAEITEILEEMGPVEGGSDNADRDPSTAGTATTPGASTEPVTPRRFYRIPENAMLGGICSGAAAFTGVDVTLIRAILFAVSAIELAISHTGIFAIVYVVLMFVLPEATTSEERAAASGAPFNAREIVDRIKRLSRELDHDLHWKRNRRRERHERREARRAWREGLRQRRLAYGGMRGFGPPMYTPYGTRLFAGLALPVLTFTSAAAFWFGIYLVLSLLRAGSVIDWEPFGLDIEVMDTAPLWVAAFVVFILTMAVTGPLHAARRAARLALGDGAHGWYEAWDGLLGVAFGAFILWFAYTQMPEVRDLIQHLPDAWMNLRDSFRQ